MSRFAPIAFESTGTMGPTTKELFESRFSKFGLDEYGNKSYNNYYKWYLKRISIICSSYLYKVYEKFSQDVVRRG